MSRAKWSVYDITYPMNSTNIWIWLGVLIMYEKTCDAISQVESDKIRRQHLKAWHEEGSVQLLDVMASGLVWEFKWDNINTITLASRVPLFFICLPIYYPVLDLFSCILILSKKHTFIMRFLLVLTTLTAMAIAAPVLEARQVRTRVEIKCIFYAKSNC